MPFSAIEVPALAVPGCSVLPDHWVYAPKLSQRLKPATPDTVTPVGPLWLSE